MLPVQTLNLSNRVRIFFFVDVYYNVYADLKCKGDVCCCQMLHNQAVIVNIAGY